MRCCHMAASLCGVPAMHLELAYLAHEHLLRCQVCLPPHLLPQEKANGMAISWTEGIVFYMLQIPRQPPPLLLHSPQACLRPPPHHQTPLELEEPLPNFWQLHFVVGVRSLPFANVQGNPGLKGSLSFLILVVSAHAIALC